MKNNIPLVINSTPGQDIVTPTSNLMDVSVGLLTVLFVILLGFFIARKFKNNLYLNNAKKNLSIKESCSLGQREKVILLEVNNKLLVLGVTSAAITCLATFDSQDENNINYDDSEDKNFPELLKMSLRHLGKCAKK
jgi:flagellar protein FliO/FliZ